MKKNNFLLVIITCLTCLSSYGQEEKILWANRIIEVSSEYTTHEYSSTHALHRPNVLPNGGDNPNAWRPKNPQDKNAYIVVSFPEDIRAKQIVIGESENPGAIKAVYAYDEDFNEYPLFEITPRKLPISARLLNLFFDQLIYKVAAVKIVMDCSITEGYNAIDAIGVSTSNIPVSVLINTAEGVNEELQVVKLGENVNSEYKEISPVLAPNGKRMYFSRQYHPDNMGGIKDPEDIWYSDLDEKTGEWLPAKNIGAPLNTKGPNFISSISIVDGKEVFVLGNKYGKKGKMTTGVSTSTRTGNTFSKPESVEMEDDHNYSVNADFFLAKEGKVMLISAERDDSYGRRDLYVSFKKKDGKTWSKPKNMGLDLNTIGEEESPFLAHDNKTLYFSSDGYNGQGGIDIYVSHRLDNSWTKWSKPENLGKGINKEGNEEYFSIPTTGRNIFFTRGKKGEDMDIYTFKSEEFLLDKNSKLASSLAPVLNPANPNTTIKGIAMNRKTNTPLENSEVIISRLVDGLQLGTVQTNESGEYSFTVMKGYKYALSAKKDGFIAESENIDLTSKDSDDEKLLNINLLPINKGEKVVLNNIFFDFNSWKLRTSSYPELKKVLEYLKDGSINKIAVYGHTDMVGKKEYNQYLSAKRAEAVANYFIENGISANRLSSKGFGESKTIKDNSCAENRQSNRRVEFEIM